MIIVMNPRATQEDVRRVVGRVEELGLKAHLSQGVERTIIGVIGDERLLKKEQFSLLPLVEDVIPILKPYKLASREFRRENTVVDVAGVKIGGGRLAVIAGPCSVEGEEQLLSTARAVREAVRARQAERTAVVQRDRADSEAASAKAVNDFLQNDLLAQASANNQAGTSAKLDPDLKVRTALDRAAARIAGKFDRQPEVEAAIRETIGQTYSELGQYSEASKHLESALDLDRRILGAENPKTLTAMRRLGDTVRLQGRYSQAGAILRHAVEIERRVLGSEHTDTLNSMNTLALTYYQQGNYAQAEALHSQTLEIQRRVLGREHPDTLNSMNNLANDYLQQGKYVQAETLNSQILEVRRRVLGPEHPLTLSSMNNLAIDYFLQGNYAQAEALYSQTLEIRRRVLGPEHPETLVSMENLAGAYDQQGKYAQAEALYSQTLDMMRRVLGFEHPHTLVSMNNLANVYGQQGKYAQGETLFGRTLETMRRVLGPEHPYTLDALSDMALIYQRQGKYDVAGKYAAECLAARRHALAGPGRRPADRDARPRRRQHRLVSVPDECLLDLLGLSEAADRT
jgi:tetratricopeptide (TPR) repeat protein